MKNAERKKRKLSNLVVSIPRNLLHIHVCPELKLSFCSEDPSVDDPHLTVSLPPICVCKWSCQISSVYVLMHVYIDVSLSICIMIHLLVVHGTIVLACTAFIGPALTVLPLTWFLWFYS